MFKPLLLISATVAALAWSATAATAEDAKPKQPVFIVLYSRYSDHSHPRAIEERLSRLLPLVDKMREKYPQSGMSVLVQFSGTTARLIRERAIAGAEEKLLDYQRRGLIEIGYTGEEEPSYLYRPKANLILTETPEERWKAKVEAAEHFLSDFKDPVTGKPFPGLTGGLKLVQDIFGKAVFISGANPNYVAEGGDSFLAHEIRKYSPAAVMTGLPPNDVRRGISNFSASADKFSRMMSPLTDESPEVYWEDGILRLSDASLEDLTSHNTDDSVDTLKKFFGNLDRSHPRVIKLEITSYLRYLTRRADGSVVNDPLEWMYFHPDDPIFPMTMHPLVTQTAIEKGYHNELAVLQWLNEEFFPANPGSRFLSIGELKKMAGPPAPPELSVDEVKKLAADVNQAFAIRPMEASNYIQSGGRFYSLAECFEILAQTLSELDKTKQLPARVKPVRTYGPFEIPNANMGSTVDSFTTDAVIQKAGQIAPRLMNDEWQILPDNVTPVWIDLSGKQVNAAHFMRMMAQSLLDPTPDRVLKTNALQMITAAAFMYPQNTAITEQGLAWTFKPAPLNLEAIAAKPAAQ